MPVKILIADDHGLVREGLKLILQQQGNNIIVGEASNGREAIALATTLLPDIVLMDISMSEINGIEATRILNESLPAIRVIIISMYNTSEFIFRAFQAGAKAFINKDSAGSEVKKAIRETMHGRTFIGEGLEILPGGYCSGSRKGKAGPLNMLSKRELQTLQLVVEGKTNVAIAEQLKISPKSVETYRLRLMQKLGVDNVRALVKFALLHGITPP